MGKSPRPERASGRECQAHLCALTRRAISSVAVGLEAYSKIPEVPAYAGIGGRRI